MRNDYAIKVLEDKVKEIEETRDYIIAQSFPHLNTEEIIKIDLSILTLKKSIGALGKYTRQKIKPDTLFKIYNKINKGEKVTDLSVKYNIHEKTLYNKIKEIREIEEKYK